MQVSAILDLIAKVTREVVPALERHQFLPSDRLQDLGIHSVDRVEIIAILVESLALNIPRVALASAKNIGELAELLHEKANAR